MLASNRVIWKDNATLKDLSVLLNNFASGTQVIPLVAAEDKIYVGSDVPFNHRYFSVSVVNALASAITVDIWDGDEWVPAVDVVDYTQATAGKVFSQSGIIRWATERNETWAVEATTENMTDSGLETLKIYNMYWARFTFSADLTAGFALKYVGHKFSTDEDLNGEYADLNRSTVLTAYKAGKTTWEEQHIIAAEKIFRHLRQNRKAWAKGQIFEWEPFTLASTHMVAKIIYNSFGEDYEGRRDDALESYNDAMEGVIGQGIDEDMDGHDHPEEHAGTIKRLIRV